MLFRSNQEKIQRFEVIGENSGPMVAILIILIVLMLVIVVLLFLIKYGIICRKKPQEVGQNYNQPQVNVMNDNNNNNKVDIGEIEINVQHQQLEDEN